MTVDEKERIRRDVTAGICPVCGKGPFVVVSVHTNKVHNIDKKALRRMAGMTTNEPTCSPEFSARAAERGHREHADLMRKFAANSKGKTWAERGGREFTEAGRERNARTLADWVAANPDEAAEVRARAAVKSKTPEAIAKQSKSLREAHRKRST